MLLFNICLLNQSLSVHHVKQINNIATDKQILVTIDNVISVYIIAIIVKNFYPTLITYTPS